MRVAEFYGYATEREQIRLRKEADLSFPWTEDQILRDWKFTNVRRENDRTSRAFIKNFYAPHRNDDMKDILLNCAIRRYFGTEEFSAVLGWIPFHNFRWQELENAAKSQRDLGNRVFTGAYVITNGGVSAPKEYVVAKYYINELWKMIPMIVDCAIATQSWKAVATMMRKVDGFGGSGFMTKETLVDTTYTNFWKSESLEAGSTLSVPVDWYIWTPIGPGARRGLARVFGHDDVDCYDAMKIRNNEDRCMEYIGNIMNAQEEFWKHGNLNPHDIQFTLCEFDKYERVRLGQGKPKSSYKVRT